MNSPYEDAIRSIGRGEASVSGDLPVVAGGNLPPIYVDLRERFDDALSSFEGKGFIDQKFLYLDARSAQNWRNLIEFRGYRTYQHCKEALDDLLSSKIWLENVGGGNLGAIAVLGAGAYEKDLSIIRSIEDHAAYKDKSVEFFLLDSSFHMIEDTLRNLKKVKLNVVSLSGIRTDFLKISLYSEMIRSASKTMVCFFILGGTLCNIDEDDFFRAIYRSSKSGDLLIIGTDFIENRSRDAFIAELRGAYDNDALRDLIVPPVKNLLEQQNRTADIDQLRRDTTIEVFEKGKGAPIPLNLESHIPDTITVVIKTKVKGEDVVCATSNRYQEDSFRLYVESKHFEWLAAFPCPRRSSYKQIVLRRT